MWEEELSTDYEIDPRFEEVNSEVNEETPSRVSNLQSGGFRNKLSE